MFKRIVFGVAAASLLMLGTSASASARNPRVQPVEIDEIGKLLVIKDSIKGDEITDYQLNGAGGQILSVDLQSSNSANYFNVALAGADQAIFIGSNSGMVADVALPESGEYVIRVYLMRSAARRNEKANFSLAISLQPPEFADSLAGGPDYWAVRGVGEGESLNLRSGPATRYASIGKIANGEVLQNRGCRMTGGERWCQIRATHSGVTGWVAGRFLMETAAPRAPEMPAGGPVGNGVPFDATGSVPCTTNAEQPVQECLFGVIREGQGNAGIWFALGAGNERQITFEGGKPIVANSADELSFEKTGDLFIVRVGAERYEIPEAVINGG